MVAHEVPGLSALSAPAELAAKDPGNEEVESCMGGMGYWVFAVAQFVVGIHSGTGLESVASEGYLASSFAAQSHRGSKFLHSFFLGP